MFFSRYFSLKPHLAGSSRSKELADEIRTRWDNYGFRVDTLEYDVLLPRAKDNSPDYMEIKDQNGKVTMKHTFAAVVGSDYNDDITSYFLYALFLNLIITLNGCRYLE